MNKNLLLIVLLSIALALGPVCGRTQAAAEYDPITKQAFDAILASDHEQLQACIHSGLDLYATNLIGMPLPQVCIGMEDLDALELLLKAGYDANHELRYGEYLIDTAIRDQNLALIQLLLNYGADPSLPDELGSTPLNSAASYCYPEVLALLLRDNELVHTTGIGGASLLHNAMKSYDFADDPRPEEAISLLLAAGLDINVGDDAGQTPLFDAVSPLDQDIKDPELVRFLLEHGADPSARDNRGETPLRNGGFDIDIEVLELLLKAGADINASDENGRTIMHNAALYCYDSQRFEFLHSKGAELDVRDSWGYTPVHLALIKPNSDGEAALLDLGAEYDLAAAAGKGDLAEVSKIATTTDVISSDPQLAELACSLAAMSNHRDVFDLLVNEGAKPAPVAAVYLGDEDLLKALLDQGADPNRRYRRKSTALHIAADKNDPAAIELLCDYGAELDALDDRHQTPLLTAVRNYNLAATNKLLALGADPDIPGILSTPPLGYAVNAETPEFCEALLNAGANVMFRDAMEATPLHKAAVAFRNPAATIELLIAHGADPNAQDENGSTPLSYACSLNKTPEAITALVENGADPNIANDLGFTPLSWVVSMGDKDIVARLLDLGADPNVAYSWGGTPLWVAKNNGNTELAELLESHGAQNPPPEVIAEIERYKELFWPDED